MADERRGRMEVRDVTLAVAGDNDGSEAALRGWLMSAGPDVPWTLRPPAASAGQGLADGIGLGLSSAAAAVELYDRVRQWITSRGQQARPVTVRVVLDDQGSAQTVTVTIDPQALAAGHDPAA
jgi:hypothetical protein